MRSYNNILKQKQNNDLNKDMYTAGNNLEIIVLSASARKLK
jgi:hypothetical protein